jgi:hypothetical protein
MDVERLPRRRFCEGGLWHAGLRGDLPDDFHQIEKCEVRWKKRKLAN